MKKVFNFLLVGIALAATSCSELPEYELPYELSPTSEVGLDVAVTPENSLCPGPVATFNVDSQSTVHYVVQPAADDAPTSEEIWEDGESVSFDSAGTDEVNIEGVEMGEEYTIYSVTVNENGIRSEEVTSSSFTVSSFQEIVDASVPTEVTGSPSAFGAQSPVFETTLTAEGDNVYSVGSLWGPNWVAWATGVADYAGAFPYPGTITINPDYTVTVESEAGYALGGDGTYDPCTGTFDLSIVTSLFDSSATEEVETNTVTVEFVPGHNVVGEGEGEGEEGEGEEGEGSES